MTKRSIQALFVVALVSAITLAGTLPAFADGASAYGPYGPHRPEETGLADGIVLNIIAVSTYVAGMGFLVVSKLLKKNAA